MNAVMTKERTYGLSARHLSLYRSFLSEERSRGRRPRGLESLRHRTPWFIRFLEERGKHATETTIVDAYAYQGFLVEHRTKDGEPFSARSVLSYLEAATVFMEWLCRSGEAFDNPFSSIRRVRAPERLPRGILTEQEMEKLLSELHAWDSGSTLLDQGRRYLVHVIAELQYASGLRVAEVAALTCADLDLERGLVYVRDGKKGSNRVAFLTEYAVEVLGLFLTEARPLLMNRRSVPSRDTLFLHAFDRLTHLVNAELASACDRLGLPRVTSHGFRHALGYHLLRAGVNLRHIQAILGHKLLKDTETYTKIDVGDLKNVFDACHPRMRA